MKPAPLALRVLLFGTVLLIGLAWFEAQQAAQRGALPRIGGAP